MDDETVTMKDAAFMLDTDMEQDMQSYAKEVTLLAIKKINTTPKLYTDIKKGIVDDPDVTVDNTAQTCYDYAEAHDNEFGELFQSELDQVDWAEVIRRV